MGTLSLRLPQSLHDRVRDLAKRDGVSVNQFITIAAAEKASALLARETAGPAGDLFARVTQTLTNDRDVVFAYIFGSRATGHAGAASDVDVALRLRSGVDAFEARLRLLGELQRALGTDAVDLIVLDEAPLSLAGRVLTTRRVIVDRDPYARHRYESLTARMFADFRIREHRLLDAMVTHGRS